MAQAGAKLRLFVDAPLSAGTEVSSMRLSALRRPCEICGRSAAAAIQRHGQRMAEPYGLAKRPTRCRERAAAQSDVPDLWLAFAPIKTPADYVSEGNRAGVRVLLPVLTNARLRAA